MKTSFKTLSFIFFIPLLLLIFPLHSQAEEGSSTQTKDMQKSTDNEVENWERIISKGVGAMSSESESTARDDAIESAIMNAVAKAVGSIVSSQSVESNYTLLEERIFSKASDYLKSYKILDEYKDGDLYFVKIEAQVDLDSISDVLQNIGLLSMRRQPMDMENEPESMQVEKEHEFQQKEVLPQGSTPEKTERMIQEINKAKESKTNNLIVEQPAGIDKRTERRLKEILREKKNVLQKYNVQTIERLRPATGSVGNSMRDTADKIEGRSMEEVGMEKEKIVANSKSNIKRMEKVAIGKDSSVDLKGSQVKGAIVNTPMGKVTTNVAIGKGGKANFGAVKLENSQMKGAIANTPGQTLANVAIGSNSKANMSSVNMEKSRMSENILKRMPANAAIGKNNKLDLENSEDAFMQIERILAKMKEANIVFNTPPSMNVTDETKLQLVLSLMKQIKELEQMIEAPGKKESERIKVYNSMEARLTSTDFEIEARLPEEQAVTMSGVTKWEWRIKPIKAGPGQLHLTLSAVFAVDGNKTRHVIRVFDKTIEVEVTGWQTVSTFVKQNWQWLWTIIVVPVVGWLLSRWRRRRNATTTG